MPTALLCQRLGCVSPGAPQRPPPAATPYRLLRRAPEHGGGAALLPLGLDRPRRTG
jgi:hypothetical protein